MTIPWSEKNSPIDQGSFSSVSASSHEVSADASHDPDTYRNTTVNELIGLLN